jgi:hypothetical protein
MLALRAFHSKGGGTATSNTVSREPSLANKMQCDRHRLDKVQSLLQFLRFGGWRKEQSDAVSAVTELSQNDRH